MTATGDELVSDAPALAGGGGAPAKTITPSEHPPTPRMTKAIMSMALPAGMDAVATSDGSSGGHISTPRKTIPGPPSSASATGWSILPRPARQGRTAARPVCSPR
jgi:hypothetical protein